MRLSNCTIINSCTQKLIDGLYTQYNGKITGKITVSTSAQREGLVKFYNATLLWARPFSPYPRLVLSFVINSQLIAILNYLEEDLERDNLSVIMQFSLYSFVVLPISSKIFFRS